MLKGKRRRLVLLIALAILGIAAWLRLWQLGSVPAFFHFDEGNNGTDALSVLAGNHRLFFEANRGREGLIIYAVAAATALLGRSMPAARLTGALCSTLAVLAVFWLGAVIFSEPHDQAEDKTAANFARWRPLVIGGVGAGVMAASLGLAILGRTGLRANFLPLLLPLAAGLLWTGLQRRSTGRLIGAGAVTGLLAYTYISARFFPVLLLLWGASFLLPDVEGSIRRKASKAEKNATEGNPLSAHPLTRSPAHGESRTGRAGYAVRGLVLYTAAALIVALPMIVYFLLHPADFSNRSAEVWLFNSQLYDGNPLSTLLHNIGLQLSVLGVAGDPSWRSNYANLPLLHPIEASFFWLGVIALLVQWRRAYSRLLLLWLPVFLAPAVFSYDLPRNTFRMLAMAPAIYLTVGYGFWVAAATLAGRFGRRAPMVLATLVALAALLIGARAAYSGHLLFDRWAHEVEANVAAPNVEWVDMINTAAAAPPDEAFVIPTSAVGEYALSSFAYLYQGQAPVHMLDSSAADFPERLYELLAADAAHSGLATVAAVDWEREAVADAPGRIPFLLNKYGRHAATEERTYYMIDRYTNVDTAAPWSLYSALEPLTVTLDGGISLTGIAAGTQGGEQLPTQAGAAEVKPLPAGSDPLWLALRWQADGSPKGDYRLSLRLFDAAGAVAWQQDSSLVDDLNQPTSQWTGGQVAESYHTLTLPADLPPGRYEMRAIVYDETTLTPIVQVGIWTPEIVLAQVER